MNTFHAIPAHPSAFVKQRLFNAERGFEFHPAQRLPVNTLEQALHFARLFANEIRQDTKSRRLYRNFVALTNNQFEALLAFSLWKVHGWKASTTAG